METQLYLVPTPIGNLEDITHRAVRILGEVDVILAEDTRHTGKLLQRYSISNKMMAYHQNNEHKLVDNIVERISNGETMALVTDAGTPGISDPGYLLIRECVEKDLKVECLPGATAFVPALVNSGLPCDRFAFEGFLPHKKGRQKRLEALQNETKTMVFYESPHRLLKTIDQFIECFGPERRCSIARELTKIYEEYCRGTLAEMKLLYETKKIKGEFVIVVQGKERN